MVVLVLILPAILYMASHCFSWLLATELSRLLGIVLTPEQFTLLLDKFLDIVIHAVEIISLAVGSKFGSNR